MKNCPKCGINVGGQFQHCPLCQNELTGENGDHYFPPVRKLRKKSLFYKIQLFAALAAMIICLFLDFMFGLHGTAHWSIISTATIIVIEFVMRRLIRKHSPNIHYYIFHISLASTIILLFFSYYLNFWNFSVAFILPSLLMLVVGSMFAFGLNDKTGNVMAYLLTAICGGIIIPSLVLVKAKPHFALLWQICLMLTTVVLTGTLIFKGSKVLNEIHKRLHM